MTARDTKTRAALHGKRDNDGLSRLSEGLKQAGT